MRNVININLNYLYQEISDKPGRLLGKKAKQNLHKTRYVADTGVMMHCSVSTVDAQTQPYL